MIRQMRVAIIGQGYVCLTISVGALSAGHEVVGIDLSASLVSSLKSGKSHIEGITDESIASGLASGKYFPTSNYGDVDSCEIVVIAVPTPLDGDGKPDLRLLESASDSLSTVLKSRVLIINESTSHPGTLREIIRTRIEKGSPQNLQTSSVLSSIDQKLKAQGVAPEKFERPPTPEELKAQAAKTPQVKNVELEPKLALEIGRAHV